MIRNTTPLPESPCPKCGYVMDSATGVGHRATQPKPRDFGLCFRCGEPLVYQQDLHVRSATPIDMEGLRTENPQGYQALKRAIVEIQKRASERN